MHYPLLGTRKPDQGTVPGWFSSAASEHNLQGKLRPLLTKVCETPLRLGQSMLSHWHVFSTVEVTVYLSAGPQTQEFFFSLYILPTTAWRA